MRYKFLAFVVISLSISGLNATDVDFTKCLERVRNGEAGTGKIGATDNHGNVLEDVGKATGLTYGLSLQQAPLRVTNEDALLASLIVLPHNDEWWRELIEWLAYPHTWSISAVTSIAWVVTAYIFTVIDSFMGDLTTTINSHGQGSVGSLWIWLLPIVIGWLQLSPKCDEVRVRSAVERANKIAHVATDTHPVLVQEHSTEQRAIYLAFSEGDEDDDVLRRGGEGIEDL
ncbi:hypothetical protein H1R20_g13896, partial [Candolleomyces eurysporus]